MNPIVLQIILLNKATVQYKTIDFKVINNKYKTDIYIYIYIQSALQKYWNSKVKIVLLALESRHLQIWSKDEYETKLQNVTFYYWVIQHIDVLPAKKFLSDVSISIGTVASQVFLSDQLCPAAFILQVLKAGNVSYQFYPLLLHSESCIRWWHTNQDEDEEADFERKASNLDAKRKGSQLKV